MPEYTTWVLYCLMGLGLAWLGAAGLLLRLQGSIKGSKWLIVCWVVWPLCLLDEAVLLADGEWMILYGWTDWVPVLLMTLFYRALKPSLVAQVRPSKWALWLPVSLCFLMQLPLALGGVAEKQVLTAGGPIGHPLDFWPVYTIAMLVCFGVLVLSLLITETVQKYHKHLPEQVANPQQYRLRYMVIAMSAIAGISVVLTLLVTAVTFGFLSVLMWQSGLDLVLAIVMLTVLYLLLIPQRTAPSLLDYEQLDASYTEQAKLRESVDKAEQVMQESQAYRDQPNRHTQHI